MTWDTWTWAASVFKSRTFVLSAMPSWIQHGKSSPLSTCESAGVLVLCLDMLNREASAAHLASKLSDEKEIVVDSLSVVPHGRARMHCQLYENYGDLDNERLVLH